MGCACKGNQTMTYQVVMPDGQIIKYGTQTEAESAANAVPGAIYQAIRR